MRANEWNNRYQVGQRVLVRDYDGGPWIRAKTVTPAREGPQSERSFIDVETGARRLTVPLRVERIKPEQPVGRYEAITEVPLHEVPLPEELREPAPREPEKPAVLEKFARVFRGPRPARERRYDDGALEFDFSRAERDPFDGTLRAPQHLLNLPVRHVVDEACDYNVERVALTFGTKEKPSSAPWWCCAATTSASTSMPWTR